MHTHTYPHTTEVGLESNKIFKNWSHDHLNQLWRQKLRKGIFRTFAIGYTPTQSGLLCNKCWLKHSVDHVTMLPCYHFTMLPNPAQHQVLGIPARRSCSLYYISQPKDDIDNGFIAWIMSKFTMTAMVMMLIMMMVMVMVTIVLMMVIHRGSTDSGIRSDDQLEVQVPLLFSFPFFSIFFQQMFPLIFDYYPPHFTPFLSNEYCIFAFNDSHINIL